MYSLVILEAYYEQHMSIGNGSNSQALLSKLAKDGVSVTRKSISTIASGNILKHNEQLLYTINSQVLPSPINGYASLVNYAPTASQPIHRWFRYREGYSIELVKELIKELPRGSTILDPFCGAGTSLLAAREIGLPSIGVDVNPISILVSKVKTTWLSDSDLIFLNDAVKKLKKLNVNDQADQKPLLKIVDKVFDQDILQALLIFRRAIKALKNDIVRDFIFVAWLSILENVSNVYKEGNGLKYRNRKRTDEGYIHLAMKDWQSVIFPENRFSFVRDKFFGQLQSMMEDLPLMPQKTGDVTLIEDAAEHLDKHIHQNSVAMAIFSPPYCNCFNYFKMYKVELWMGEFVKSYEDIQLLNRRGLRSHVETVLKRKEDCEEPISESFASLLDGLKLWDRRIPRAVRGYFIDMRQVLRNLHLVLKPGAKAVLVVGNSSYGGVIIPTDAILAKIGQGLGFKLEKLAVARHLTTSSQQRAVLNGDLKEYLRESIIILTKEDPRLQDHDLIQVDELPLKTEDVKDKVFSIRNTGLTALTHKFHRYPGKFIPHIPRWALSKYLAENEVATIFDPFCGSGTTLVESILKGYNAIGLDIDPIAVLVSRVKTRKINSDLLTKIVQVVCKKVKTRTKPKFRPSIKTLEHWFSPEAITDLGVIRDIIDEYKKNVPVYEFLVVCFASIIRRASNADNQTQKTYVSHTKIKEIESAKPLFVTAIKDYSQRLIEIGKIKGVGKSLIINESDAKSFAPQWNKEKRSKVDLIITSPPYLNSVDYVYNQMAEYFWIGDLFRMENQRLQNDHKRKYIGTDKVVVDVYKNILMTSIPEIDQLVVKLFKKSKKNAYVVAKYFLDMLEHFRNAKKVLKKGGNYVCVIGDSLVSGESIPVHQLIIKCAEFVEFEFTFKFGYEIRNRHMRFPRMGRGGIVRYDWVLNFRKK